MCVVYFAERTPVNIVVDSLDSSLLHFFADGIEIVACNTADEHCDDSNYYCNGLGLLISFLVGKSQNNERNETYCAYDHAHVVPQPEEQFVLFAGGFDAVSFLPKLGANDHKYKVKYKCADQLVKAGHKGPVYSAIEDQDRKDLKSKGY